MNVNEVRHQIGSQHLAYGTFRLNKSQYHIMEIAYEMGIRLFDTSASYGNKWGDTETWLGRHLPYSDVTVITRPGFPYRPSAREFSYEMQLQWEKACGKFENHVTLVNLIHVPDCRASLIECATVMARAIQARPRSFFGISYCESDELTRLLPFSPVVVEQSLSTLRSLPRDIPSELKSCQDELPVLAVHAFSMSARDPDGALGAKIVSKDLKNVSVGDSVFAELSKFRRRVIPLVGTTQVARLTSIIRDAQVWNSGNVHGLHTCQETSRVLNSNESNRP